MPPKKENADLITLREALNRVTSPQPPHGYWLFLPVAEEPRALDTKCYFDDGSMEDDGEHIVGSVTYRANVNVDDIENCVLLADQLAGRPDDNARFEVFLYFCNYDAYPEMLGAPPPLPPDEATHIYDLNWYNELGPEDSTRRCKRENCDRGVVQFSSFCRPHHFEMILKQPCPFDH